MAKPQKVVAAEDEEVPQYKLLDKAYLSGIRLIKGPFPKGVNEEAVNDIYLDPEQMPFDEETEERKPIIFETRAIPGSHMEPLNAAARAMCEKYAKQYASSPNDAIDKLTRVVGEGVVPAQGA